MHKLAVKFSRAASVFPEGDDLCIAIRRELILNLEFACKLTLHSQICTAREVLRLDDVSVSRNRATNPPLSTLNNNYSPDDACLWAVGKRGFPRRQSLVLTRFGWRRRDASETCWADERWESSHQRLVDECRQFSIPWERALVASRNLMVPYRRWWEI